MVGTLAFPRLETCEPWRTSRELWGRAQMLANLSNGRPSELWFSIRSDATHSAALACDFPYGVLYLTDRARGCREAKLKLVEVSKLREPIAEALGQIGRDRVCFVFVFGVVLIALGAGAVSIRMGPQEQGGDTQGETGVIRHATISAARTSWDEI